MSRLTASPKVKPPIKGSFPLDHDGECTENMKMYMKCLSVNHGKNSLCRQESKDYFQCRMDNDLMTREEWDTLGYGEFKQNKNTTESKPKDTHSPS